MRQPITVFVNGKPVVLEEGALLASLLSQHFSISPETKGVAVACNEEVISKSRWRDIRLTPEARIEIVHAVQGG